MECSVERSIELIGGKWKLRILRTLILDGDQGFNALARRVSGISNKVLTQNLRALEASGVIEPSRRPSGASAYGVTPAGADLMPILRALGAWEETHSAALSPPPVR